MEVRITALSDGIPNVCRGNFKTIKTVEGKGSQKDLRFLYFTWTGEVMTPVKWGKYRIHSAVPTATTSKTLQRDSKCLS